MPRGFDKFNEDVSRFELSKLFQEKYKEFIDIISMPFGECTSKSLEATLKIPGSSIRRLARHARKKGVPVISNEKGYCLASNYDELRPTLDHLTDRVIDMLDTVSCLKQCFKQQGELFANQAIGG